jgi:hypothetical protein
MIAIPRKPPQLSSRLLLDLSLRGNPNQPDAVKAWFREDHGQLGS